MVEFISIITLAVQELFIVTVVHSKLQKGGITNHLARSRHKEIAITNNLKCPYAPETLAIYKI